MKASLDDGSVRAEEDDMRNSENAIDVCRDILGIYDLVPVHAVSLGRVETLLRGIFPHCNAEHVKVLS